MNPLPVHSTCSEVFSKDTGSDTDTDELGRIAGTVLSRRIEYYLHAIYNLKYFLLLAAVCRKTKRYDESRTKASPIGRSFWLFVCFSLSLP